MTTSLNVLLISARKNGPSKSCRENAADAWQTTLSEATMKREGSKTLAVPFLTLPFIRRWRKPTAAIKNSPAGSKSQGRDNQFAAWATGAAGAARNAALVM